LLNHKVFPQDENLGKPNKTQKNLIKPNKNQIKSKKPYRAGLKNRVFANPDLNSRNYLPTFP
jgi:hypothetical protein